MSSTRLLVQVVKLSDAVQPLPRQTTQFVHGVPDSFLAVGERKSHPGQGGRPRFSRGAYFMGKAVWAKVCTLKHVLWNNRNTCPHDTNRERDSLLHSCIHTCCRISGVGVINLVAGSLWPVELTALIVAWYRLKASHIDQSSREGDRWM